MEWSGKEWGVMERSVKNWSGLGEENGEKKVLIQRGFL